MEYERFQFVKVNRRTLILISKFTPPYDKTKLWETWEINHKGTVTSLYHLIYENEIKEIIKPKMNIDIESIRYLHSDNVYVEPFIIHYQKLKVEHFLNNL